MGITVSTSPQQVTASVSEDKVTATVSAPPVTATVQAGVGATGAAGAAGASGSSGVVSVSAPITNSGTGSAAVLALSVGSGLGVSAGALIVSSVPLASLAQGGATTGQVVRWNGTAWAAGDVTAGSTAWDAITGKPTFATVATSGSYNDLSDKPLAYSLPTATASVLGGVKIGSGISIDDNGVISSASSYTLPTATGSVLGGVKIGGGVTITDGVISVSTSYAATSHSHGNISTDGLVNGNTASGQIVVTTSGGALTTATSISSSQVSGLGTLATQNGTFSGTSSGTNTGDQTITLTGDVTGSGTGSFAATLSSTGVAAGTYTSVTVDAKGRVTAGSSPAVAYSSLSGVPSTFAPTTHKASHATGGSDALTAADIGAAATSHSHSWSAITSGLPTTLSGYGITDGVTTSDARLNDSRTPTSHTHGNITNGGAIGSTADRLVVTTTSGVLTTAAIGSGLTLSSGTISASGGGSTNASDLTGGTLGDARLSDKVLASVNMYLWQTFR